LGTVLAVTAADLVEGLAAVAEALVQVTVCMAAGVDSMAEVRAFMEGDTDSTEVTMDTTVIIMATTGDTETTGVEITGTIMGTTVAGGRGTVLVGTIRTMTIPTMVHTVTATTDTPTAVTGIIATPITVGLITGTTTIQVIDARVGNQVRTH
jgi:hypothetical protein